MEKIALSLYSIYIQYTLIKLFSWSFNFLFTELLLNSLIFFIFFFEKQILIVSFSFAFSAFINRNWNNDWQEWSKNRQEKCKIGLENIIILLSVVNMNIVALRIKIYLLRVKNKKKWFFDMFEYSNYINFSEITKLFFSYWLSHIEI